MHHIRIHQAIYQWSNYVRTINTIDTTNVSFHGVRSVGQSRTLKGTDTRISTRISLYHSGFKGPAISSVQGIVTHNNLPELLFRFLMNTEISPTFATEFHVISQQLDPFSTFSSLREQIHEQEVNLDNLLSFSWKYLSKVPKLPKLRYPSDANSRQRDKESLNSSTQAKP